MKSGPIYWTSYSKSSTIKTQTLTHSHLRIEKLGTNSLIIGNERHSNRISYGDAGMEIKTMRHARTLRNTSTGAKPSASSTGSSGSTWPTSGTCTESEPRFWTNQEPKREETPSATLRPNASISRTSFTRTTTQKFPNPEQKHCQGTGLTCKLRDFHDGKPLALGLNGTAQPINLGLPGWVDQHDVH